MPKYTNTTKMKKVLLVLGMFCFLISPSFAISAASTTASETVVEGVKENAKNEWKSLSKKERKLKKKKLRKKLKTLIKDLRKGNDEELILLVILGILLPPLAMALYDGITNRFWISLLLTILGWIPGIIYTLIVILGEN